MNQVLLPCPFCGKPPVLKQDHDSLKNSGVAWVHIGCDRCLVKCHTSACLVPSEWSGRGVRKKIYFTDEEAMSKATEDAAKNWNTRKQGD